METYQEMRARHQRAIDGFPLHFAFGQEQLDRKLAELGATIDDVVGIGWGGFVLQEDAPRYIALVKTMQDELDDAMQDPGFARGAFLHEMYNHEYPINLQGDWDVCSCFGRVEYGESKEPEEYLRELGFGPEIAAAYASAASECMRGEW